MIGAGFGHAEERQKKEVGKFLMALERPLAIVDPALEDKNWEDDIRALRGL